MTRRIFLIEPIKDQICSYLSFEDRISFRDALNLPSLKCSYLFIAKGYQRLWFPGVNDCTVTIYQLSQKYGRSLFKVILKAIKQNRTEIVRFILSQHRFDQSEKKCKILAKAISLSRNLIIPILVDFDFDLNCSRCHPRTLFCATKNMKWEDYSTLKLLLEYGVDIDQKDHAYGRTVLMYAAKYGYITLMQFLITAGANLEATCNSGYTALWWAVNKNQEEAVKVLLPFYSNSNEQNFFESLARAIENNNLNIAQLLIQTGINVNIRNRENKTLLTIATNKCKYEMVKLLLEAGADPSMKYGGLTALRIAQNYIERFSGALPAVCEKFRKIIALLETT